MADNDTDQAIPSAAGAFKRVRKQVQHFKTDDVVEKGTFVVEKGPGIALNEFPYFMSAFEKEKTDGDLAKNLHSLMFGFPGRKIETKKHIRLFSGFVGPQSEEERFKKVVENKKKWTISVLKDALSLFGLEKGGSREDLARRLVSFLVSPEVTKKDGSVALSKKRKSNSTSGKKASKSKKSKSDKPPKNPSAFLNFSNAKRADVKSANPEASFGELGKLLGALWQKLSVEEKAEWASKEESGAEDEVDNIGGDDDDDDDIFGDDDEEVPDNPEA